MGVHLASAQGSGQVFLLGEGDMATMHRWDVPRKQYEALPKWAPRSNAVPFSIADAVRTSEEWIKKRHPEVKKFDVSSVSLVRAGCCVPSDERWFYRVEFRPVVAGQRLHGGHFVAVVLLDGSLVEPKAEKRDGR